MKSLTAKELELFFKTVIISAADIPDEIKGLMTFQNFVSLKDKTSVDSYNQARISLLEEGLDNLKNSHPKLENILREFLVNKKRVTEIARELGDKHYNISRQKSAAFELLTKILSENEASERKKLATTLEQYHPQKLFGLKKIAFEIVNSILNNEQSKVTLIIGIGGIGKTTLAERVIKEIILNPEYSFHHPIKIVAEGGIITKDQLQEELAEKLLIPQELTNVKRANQIKNLLNVKPHLILIDNLESDISQLTHFLTSVSGTSQFIITSRVLPAAKDKVNVWTLEELSIGDSISLIRNFPFSNNQKQELAIAPESKLKTIYEKVGGNPFALKLILGLTSMFSIPEILKSLRTLDHLDIEAMYRDIFLKSWQSLDTTSQSVLLNMLFIPIEGDTLKYIYELTNRKEKISQHKIQIAISELRDRCLVSVSGSIWSNSYKFSIHNLTRSFLQTEIIQLPNQSI